MYDIENLYEARSVADAIALLRAHPEAKIIAGGSDVLIKIREGKLAGCSLVSIQTLDELRGVSLDNDGSIRIGPLTSFSHLDSDPIIREKLPVLAEAGETIGGPQLRNVATIGGNVSNGVTSADSASTLLAYDAVMEYSGPNGVRLVPMREHYTGPGKTALAHDEVLTAIIIPRESYENTHGCYIKYAMRAALDIATLGCSANVRLSPDRQSIERLRLAFGVAGPVPLRAPSAEAEAAGKPTATGSANAGGSLDVVVDAIAKAALADIHPRTSWRATKEFRTHIAEEIARRAIKGAITRAL
jgi:xanthine dehydrogenase FAD-binding subunit